jgi:hypothetical protein
MLGGGFGHLADMIVRMRNNSNLLRKQKYFHKKELYIKASSKIALDERVATKEELEIIRAEVRKLRIDEIKKSVLSLILSAIITGVVLFLLLQFVTKLVN